MIEKKISIPVVIEWSVPRLLVLGVLTRVFTDTGVQLFFPFFPLIATGLGISAQAMGQLVSIRSLMGLFSPLFGVAMDRYGYRLVMRLGLFLAGLGLLVVGSSSGYFLAMIGMMLMGLGSFSFIPALQAYLSNRLPYERRARGLGIVEYAWALAGILGLLGAGALIERTSWRVPFWIIGVALILFSFVYRLLPAAREGSDAAAPRPTLRSLVQMGGNRRSAYAVLVAGGLIMFATWHTFLNYGTLLTQEYALDAAALGRVASVLGIADLVASVLVTLVSDRLGKRRSIIGATGLAVVAFSLLPILNRGFVPLMAGLLVARFSFEFAIVSNLALLSEQSPAERGKVLTLGAAFALIGTSLAGFTSPAAYETFGASGLGVISALGMLGAFLLNSFLVQEAELAPEPESR